MEEHEKNTSSEYFRTTKNYNNKGIAWLYSEVCALLDVWADDEIQQQLAGRLHNMCVYEKISQRLSALGIDRTAEQCREKIKKLKRDYKIVTDNKYSPAFARKLLGCYDKVHEVFGKCAVVKPSSVIESLSFKEENTTSTSKLPEQRTPNAEEVDVISKEKSTYGVLDYSTDEESDCETSLMDDEQLSKHFTEDKALDALFTSLKKSQDDVHLQLLKLYQSQYQRELENEKNRLLQNENRRQLELQREYRKYEAIFATVLNNRGVDTINGNRED